MKNFFVVLGGMGTMATESYIHAVNELTKGKNDQDFLDYILVNHATIPDRTAYILDHTKPSPLMPLLDDIKNFNQLKPAFYTLPCNTAHYFYDELSKACQAPLLNMPQETVKEIRMKYPQAKRIGVLATEGTIKYGIYDQEILNAGYELVNPTAEIMQLTMDLIYTGVKKQNYVDRTLYHTLVKKMVEELNCDAVILGCTELSVAQEREPVTNLPVVDSQIVLAQRTVDLARKMRK